jgi:hypothetical protein
MEKKKEKKEKGICELPLFDARSFPKSFFCAEVGVVHAPALLSR